MAYACICHFFVVPLQAQKSVRQIPNKYKQTTEQVPEQVPEQVISKNANNQTDINLQRPPIFDVARFYHRADKGGAAV